MRWCTRQLKLKPFEQYVGDDPVISYVGIRADEDRDGLHLHEAKHQGRLPVQGRWDHQGRRLSPAPGSGPRAAVLLQLADSLGLLLLLLPAEERVGGAAEAPSGPLRGIQEVREGRSRHWGAVHVAARRVARRLADPARLAEIAAREQSKGRRGASTLMGILSDSGDEDDDAACLICQL